MIEPYFIFRGDCEAALADGGTATQPVDKTFWSDAFGMLTDRFGVNWMVTLEAS
jgi:PhnB protein